MILHTEKGEELIGNVHTHPRSSQPSPDDLNQFRNLATKAGNFMIVEGGDLKYAMVITDLEKAQKFFKEYDLDGIKTRLSTKETIAADESTYTEYNKKQLGLRDLLKENGMVLLMTKDEEQLEFEELKTE